ncbi:hypothetical protein Q675_31400 [Labrenzia sp. C1B70]|nr:hypothetical protein Q675_31400 [Labrenzia sp. C1B70]
MRSLLSQENAEDRFTTFNMISFAVLMFAHMMAG